VNRRLNPYLIGLAIGLGIGALAVVAAMLDPDLDLQLSPYRQWLLLACYTVSLFGFLIWWYWSRRKLTRFWMLLAVLCLAHLSGFVFYLSIPNELFPIQYSIIGPIEAVVFGLLINTGMRIRLGRRHQVS
jgi:uncharacterized membrane protein